MMTIKRLTKKESAEAMELWISSGFVLPEVGKDYEDLRKDISIIFQTASEEKDTYRMDVCFGVLLYDYLRNMPWFTERLASDDGFWRYLSLVCVPDLVGKRWGNDNADHYYVKPSRIWLKTVWWYVHLSLKDADTEKTRNLLLSANFNTDTILNLVERTGRGGTNIGVYRAIMEHYGALYGPKNKDFRSLMKLNTARTVVVEPVLYDGGINGYAISLFNDLSLK